jgi:cytidylate kinase
VSSTKDTATTSSPGPGADPVLGSQRSTFVIAIDGPSGTGKSTVSRHVARRLKAGYLDSGAIYRILTLAVLRDGADPDDSEAVSKVLAGLEFTLPTDPDQQRHRLDGEDVTVEIRSPQVTSTVSAVSRHSAVRLMLLDQQRALARSGRMVVEGRDIGTVVVPDADLKIYLTADSAERARRRLRQTVAAGGRAATEDHPQFESALQAVARDLNRRDTIDSTREHSPLQAAADAVMIDSSELGVEETVDRVLDIAAGRGIGVGSR